LGEVKYFFARDQVFNYFLGTVSEGEGGKEGGRGGGVSGSEKKKMKRK